MGKGQGSLEYLLILAAILALAVIVVLIANSMLGTPRDASTVNMDKYNMAIAGWEIRGYDKPYDPANPGTAPNQIIKGGQSWAPGGTATAPPPAYVPIGTIHDSAGNEYPVYGSPGGGSYVIITPAAGATCSDGIQNQGETGVDCGGPCTACAAVCGNNTIEPPEPCDGTDLNGQSCTTQGFASGTLACNPTCTGFDTSGCVADSDGDGVPDGADQCPGTQMGCSVNATGCPNDTDEDGVCNEKDNCPIVANPGQEDGNGDGRGDACELPVPTGLYMEQITGGFVTMTWEVPWTPYDSEIAGYKVYMDGAEVKNVAGGGTLTAQVPLPPGYAGYNWMAACGWDNAAQQNLEYSSRSAAYATVVPGQGIWIYALKDMSWAHPGSTGAATSYNVALGGSWNLFSMPLLDTVDHNAFHILNKVYAATGDVGCMMAKHLQPPIEWDIFDCGQGEASAFNVVPDEGYWIYISPGASGTINLPGSQGGARTVPLVDGWNLAGYTSLNAMATSLLDTQLGARMPVPNYSIRAYDSGGRLGGEKAFVACA